MNILSMAENKNPADADGDTPLNKTYVQGKINHWRSQNLFTKAYEQNAQLDYYGRNVRSTDRKIVLKG